MCSSSRRGQGRHPAQEASLWQLRLSKEPNPALGVSVALALKEFLKELMAVSGHWDRVVITS